MARIHHYTQLERTLQNRQYSGPPVFLQNCKFVSSQIKQFLALFTKDCHALVAWDNRLKIFRGNFSKRSLI
jgi:hypothetical protein